MPKHKLRSKSFPKERDAQSGQYTAHCSYINHDEWSFNYICKEINIKKSSRFGKNSLKVHRKGYLPRWT